MPIDVPHLQELAGKAFQNILLVLPAASGTQRDALLEALNALDDIEALADAEEELGCELDLDALPDFDMRALGENVEHLALWRSRPVAERPVPAAEAQMGGLRGNGAALRGRFDAIEGGLPPIRIGA